MFSLCQCPISSTEDNDPMGTFRRSSEGDEGDIDDLELKVIVPEGVVFAVRANDPATPVWKHVVSGKYIRPQL